jgi:hypothetical protein
MVILAVEIISLLLFLQNKHYPIIVTKSSANRLIEFELIEIFASIWMIRKMTIFMIISIDAKISIRLCYELTKP